MTRAALLKAALVSCCAGALFAAVAYWLLTPAPRGMRQLSGGPAQLSAFVDESGATVTLDMFRGKVVVFNLWAAWCAPCVQEMPSLDRLVDRLPQDTFAVVTVSQDKTGAQAAKPAFERLNLKNLKLYLEPARALTSEIGARGLPTTVIFGPGGEPLSFREGAAEWDSDEMVAFIRRLAPRAETSPSRSE